MILVGRAHGSWPEASEVFLSQHKNTQEIKTDHARLFEGHVAGENFILRVKGPERCYYVSTAAVPGCTNLKGRLDKIASTSTTHLYPLVSLHLLDRLKGFSLKKNVFGLDKALESVVELGLPMQKEKLVASGAKLLLDYSFGGESDKIDVKSIDMEMVLVQEYREKGALAKAEWIKFFGALFQQYDQSLNYFEKVKEDYDRIRKKAFSSKNRPVVLIGEPFENKWSAPSPDSDIATLVKDAGASYIFQDRKGGRLSLPVEEVLLEQRKADFWLPQSGHTSLQSMKGSFRFLEKFETVKKGRTFNSVNRVGDGVGNDYWQTAIYHPDLVLKDLVEIFHGKGESLLWYKRLE